MSLKYLRTNEAAEYLGTSCSTLSKWRLTGEGPVYRKAGPRIVLYEVRELDAWLADRLRTSTKEVSNV